jgi:hypothetical protein
MAALDLGDALKRQRHPGKSLAFNV